MSGSRQIMSIDSEPRGLPTWVKNENSFTRVGTTPFFYDTTTQSEHTLYLQTHQEGNAKKIRVYCDLRWQEALIPDLGILGIGVLSGGSAWLLGGAFLGYDYFQDTIYDCNQSVLISLKEAQIKNPICNKFIVLPPRHDNPLVAEKIVNNWRLLIKDRLHPCDSILFDGDSLDTLAKYNLDNISQVSVKSMSSQQVLKLGLDSGASHIVQINLRQLGDKIQAHAQAYDIHKKLYDPDFDSQFAVPYSKAQNMNVLAKTISHYFNLFPNAFTLAATMNYLSENKDIQVVRKKEINLIPRYLSGFGISSIEHPLGFAPWDISTSIYPSLVGHYQNWEYEIKKKCPESATSPATDCGNEFRSFRYFYLLPLMNAGVTLHTPAGAFGFAVNTGPIFASVKENEGKTRNGLNLTAGIIMGWYGFMSERYYLFLNISMNGVSSRLALRDDLIDKEHRLMLSRAVIGIGYFTPEFRRNLSNIFHSLL